MDEKMEYIPENEKMLDIMRLFLEKYEILGEDDRNLYRAAIGDFIKPKITIDPRVAMQRAAYGG